jgi:hypothetical protein
LYDCLGKKANHAESQYKEKDESACLASLRLPGNFANNKKHENNEKAHPQVEPKSASCSSVKPNRVLGSIA